MKKTRNKKSRDTVRLNRFDSFLSLNTRADNNFESYSFFCVDWKT
jgi:hypothetical protein